MNIGKHTRNIFVAACKKTGIIFLTVFLSSIAAGQTNISGVVNTYHKVVEVIPSMACLRVTNIGALDVNSYVMIVQMKGASYSTTNSTAYGDTLSLNQAGNYEIGTVCHINGDSVFLFHDLLNTYAVSGKVQLVQFGQYYAANVVDTLKAASWDSVAGTGGVIALFAYENIELNAPIYADSSGFRGGKYVQHNGDCFNSFATNYNYDPTVTAGFSTGAYKGEGVGNMTLNHSGGRGAAVNGGGGGNNHNNSGGGGANLKLGGRGGGNSSNTSNCSSTRRGEAGKALSSWGGTKIFLGGGGGAGHANHGIFTKGGGNGGGIVFIWANNLIGNNYPISANGGAGGQSQSDGAGGGGAGGTIIINVNNYFGPAVVQANGGAGGNSNDAGNVGYCYGGGGGGSGGVIYFSGPMPSITKTVTEGAAGIESGRDGTCAAEQAALAGTVGDISSAYIFSRSFDEASYCHSLILPVHVTSFQATLVHKKVSLKWKIANPGVVSHSIVERSLDASHWNTIGNVNVTDLVHDYSLLDINPTFGKIYYRIKFMERNGQITYSLVRQVSIGNDHQFAIYPNPAINRIIISGTIHGPVTIQLTDISGMKKFERTVQTIPATIDLPSLPAGIYLLRINNEVQKLVIHH